MWTDPDYLGDIAVSHCVPRQEVHSANAADVLFSCFGQLYILRTMSTAEACAEKLSIKRTTCHPTILSSKFFSHSVMMPEDIQAVLVFSFKEVPSPVLVHKVVRIYNIHPDSTNSAFFPSLVNGS